VKRRVADWLAIHLACQSLKALGSGYGLNEEI
jgi:hypothetical protein